MKDDKQIVAMDKCYYCGGPKDILIHTRMRDISGLHNKVIGTEPCQKCEELMEQGIVIISIRDGEPQEGDPPNPYRTGGLWVLTEAFMNRVFPNVSDWSRQRFAFMEDSVCKMIGLQKSTT